MTKDTVPQGFTAGLAAFDAVPVILFGMASWLLWRMTGSLLILSGGIICFTAGMLKVLWKFIVVFLGRNIWPLFVQMRIGMPLGMILMLTGFLIAYISRDMSSFRVCFFRPLPVIFAVIYILGIAAMIRFSSKLDAADPKTNWIEQTCNTVAQGAFLTVVILVFR